MDFEYVPEATNEINANNEFFDETVAETTTSVGIDNHDYLPDPESSYVSVPSETPAVPVPAYDSPLDALPEPESNDALR